MPAPNSQQDLIAYISELEQRIAMLERSAVRLDKTATRSSIAAKGGRIIYDTAANKLYAGDGTNWNALW